MVRRLLGFVAGVVCILSSPLPVAADDGFPGPDFIGGPWVGKKGTAIHFGGYGAACGTGVAALEYPRRSDVVRPPLATYNVGRNDGTFGAVLTNPLDPVPTFPIDLEVVVRCGIEFGPKPFTVVNRETTTTPMHVFASLGAGACGFHSNGAPIRCRGHVKGFTATGSMSSYEWNLFATVERGGVSLAMGDVDGDGSVEAVAGSGPGAPDSVVFVRTAIENHTNNIGAFPLFKGGVNVASGDLTGDGKAEIVMAARAGGGPHVKVVTHGDVEPSASFFAYDAAFRGGVSVAVADVVGDAKNEIITGAGPGGGPHVRVFDRTGKLLAEFFVFAPTFRGGVNVAAGHLRLDGLSLLGKAEIVASPASGGLPVVRTVTGRGVRLGDFLSYNETFRGGVNVAVGNADGAAGNEIVTGVASKAAPLVRIFTPGGKQLDGGSFFAFENYPSGVHVAVG